MGAFAVNSGLFPRPPEAQDYVSQYAHLAQLRQMMGMAPLQRQQAQQQIQAGQLDIQQKQQALNDQQAATKAMQEWDGQDFMELPSLVLKHGGSAQAVFGLKNQILQQQTEMTKLSTDQLGNEKTKNDYIAGHIANVQALPPEQQADGFQSAVQDLVSKKYISPEQAQGLKYQGPQQLDYLKKTYQGLTAMQEEALKKAQAQEASGKGAEAQAIAGEKNQQAQFFGQMGLPAGITPDMAGYAAYIQKGGKPEGYQAWKAQQEAEATEPVKTRIAATEGQARANLEAQVARGSNAALAQVPPHLVAPASAAANKAGEDYAQAQSVTQRLNAMMDAARKGNVVSYQVIPEEGTLQITTSQGVHRINQAEIQQYAGGGSLWQRMQGHFGKALTGESIPKSVLDDMAEIQKIQSQGSQLKYNNSLKTINQNYGANFKPVEMEDLKSVQGGGGQGGPTPQSHNFSLSAWQRANPGGNSAAAKAAAIRQGFNVVQ